MSYLNTFNNSSASDLPIGAAKLVVVSGTASAPPPTTITTGGSTWIRGGAVHLKSQYPELAAMLGGTDGMYCSLSTAISPSDIAWNPTRTIYIATSQNVAGQMATCTDFETWNTISVGTTTWTSVTYGSDKFIAGGRGGKLAYSSNGTSWTVINANDTTLDVVAVDYANGKYFYKDDGGQIYTSTDGVNWAETGASASPKSVDNYNNYSYLSGLSRYVIAGYDNTSTVPIVYTSTNANTWTKSTLSGATVTATPLFGYGGFLLNSGKYYIGEQGRVHSTTDFTTWTTVTAGLISSGSANNYWPGYSAIIHDGTKFIFANGQYISTSTNGTTWTAQNSSTYRQGDGILYVPGAATDKYIVTAPGRNSTSGYAMYWTSTDAGATWVDTIGTQAASAPWSYSVQVRKSANNSNIIVGSNGGTAIYYSYNGVRWYTSPNTTVSAVQLMEYLNNAFFIGDQGGGIWRSTDGINWTKVGQTSAATIIYSFVYANGIYLAGGAAGEIMRSTDGITWTQYAISGVNSIFALAYGESLFVRGGTAGQVGSSTDGITWTARTAFTSTIYSLTYASNISKWVAGDRYAGIYTATTWNGTWSTTYTASTSTPWTIEYKSNPGVYVIAGSTYYQTTTDFTTYSTATYPGGTTYGTTYNSLMGMIPGTSLLAVPHLASYFYTPMLLDLKDLNSGNGSIPPNYFADFQTVSTTIYANLKFSSSGNSTGTNAAKRCPAYAYSTDNAATWLIKDLPIGSAGIKYTGGVWMTYAYAGGTVYTSTNLSTWTVVQSAVGSDIRDVVYESGVYKLYGPSGYVAVGSTPGSLISYPNSTKSVVYNTAGTLVSNYRKSTIVYFNNKYIEYTHKYNAGNIPTILTSTDGSAWTIQSSNLSVNLGSNSLQNIKVLADGKLYLGYAANQNANVSTSTDGVTFQTITFTFTGAATGIQDYYYDSVALKYYLIAPKVGVCDLGSSFVNTAPTIIRPLSLPLGTLISGNYDFQKFDYYQGNVVGYTYNSGPISSTASGGIKAILSNVLPYYYSSSQYFKVPGVGFSYDGSWMESPNTVSSQLSYMYVKAK